MKIKLPQLKGKPPVAQKRPTKVKLRAAIARSPSRAAMNDEDDYYDAPEPNMKLSHAFVVVLVLHVIAVGGVFAFNSIKSQQKTSIFAETADIEKTEIAAPAADPLIKSAAATEPRPLTASKAGATAPAPAKKSVENWTGKTHEVRPGDTLTRISNLYGVSIAAIETENAIDDPTKIRIGAVLKVPAAGSGAPPAAPVQPKVAEASAPPSKPAAASPTATAPAATASSGEIYEVAKGDNPVTIAKKLNVSYSALMELNKIEDPRKLQIGQKLKIPKSNN